MSISKIAASISESPTLALNEEARRLRQRGEAVIHLGIGEPKNKVPVAAVLSAASILTGGDVKYTPVDGMPSLKKAIIKYMEEHYEKIVAPENIIVSDGAKLSLYNLLFSLVNPQDEVVILAPHWVSYPEIVRMVNGVPVVVTPEDGSFHPRLEDIEEVVGSYTKAIIVNSPNNPSGQVFDESFIADIVDFCERRGIYLIMDDIYHKLVFDGKQAPPVYRYTKKEIDNSRIVVVNGVSKVYGMTGFRIGWAVGPRALVEAMTRVQAQTTSCASMVGQAAAEGALTGMQNIIENLRLTIQNNRDVMMQELASFRDVNIIKPAGTFYCLPDFRVYNPDSVALSRFLLRNALVVTVPGRDFGMEGHLRLSYAGSIKDVTEGMRRIKWALDPESPKEIYIGERKVVRYWL